MYLQINLTFDGEYESLRGFEYFCVNIIKNIIQSIIFTFHNLLKHVLGHWEPQEGAVGTIIRGKSMMMKSNVHLSLTLNLLRWWPQENDSVCTRQGLGMVCPCFEN